MDKLERVNFYCSVDDKVTTGNGLLQKFSNSERFARTLKLGGIWIFVILLSALVPILHFVLVPLCLLLSLIFTYSTYVESGQLVKGEFPCPKCQKLNLLANESDDWPKQRRCCACGFLLTLSKTTGP